MRALIFSLLALVLIGGCVSPRSQVAEREVALRPGDRLLVQFTNRRVPEVRQVVDPVGDVSLPLLSKFHVAGMTLSQAKQAIEASYRPAWPPEPEVSVSRVP